MTERTIGDAIYDALMSRGWLRASEDAEPVARTIPRAELLAYLRANPDQTTTQIAQGLATNENSVSTQLRRLRAAGLVSRDHSTRNHYGAYVHWRAVDGS